MYFLYNIAVYITQFFLRIIALFSPKIKLFVNGRKNTFQQLKALENEKVIWFHSASLGEFEQGRPVIEQVKKNYPNHKILLTFFSPSGYEVRKNYDQVNLVTYLPLDTKSNMKHFVKMVNPTLAVIVKYEFWPNVLRQLKQQNVSTILISAKFRKEQAFFGFFGKTLKSTLTTFYHFFVQDQNSKDLLKSIGFENVTVSGDTRFDRVSQILKQDNTLDFVQQFSEGKYTVVAGSTWKEDENLIVEYLNTATSEEKWIIAPHNINAKHIDDLAQKINKKVVLYSQKDGKNLADFDVLIVDTIGLLTKIYAQANVAYVGGGLATGLHNILEPATYGIPVVFGANKYHKFQEANDLLAQKGAEKVANFNDFKRIFSQLNSDEQLRLKMGAVNKKYIENNVGAIDKIMQYINENLSK